MGVMRSLAVGVMAGVIAISAWVVPVQAAGVVQGELRSSQEVPTYERTIAHEDLEYVYGSYVGVGDYLYTINARDDGGMSVVKFSPNGELVKTIPYPDEYLSADTPIHMITGDAAGNLYITARESDQERTRVVKINESSDVLQVFGGNSNESGEIYSPYGVTVDGMGNLYVAHTQGQSQTVTRVAKFSQDGTFLGTVDALTDGISTIMGLDSDSDGNVYAAGLLADFSTEIRVVNAQGGAVRTIESVDSEGRDFEMVRGLLYDGDGGLYTLAVTQEGEALVAKYSTTGEYLGHVVAPHSYDRYAYAYTLGADSKGAIYIAQSGYTQNIIKFSAPADVAVFRADQPGGRAEVVVSAGELDEAAVSPPEVIGAPSDGDNTYPLGIMSFTASVPSTAPVTVTYRVVSDLAPSEVTPRKYNATTKQYASIPNATVTPTTLDDKPALQVTYQVADGGSLDEDGVVNGTIVDPVGLAVATGAAGGSDAGTGGSNGGSAGGTTAGGESVPGVPNTAEGIKQALRQNGLVVAAGVLLAAVAAGVAWYVRARRTKLTFKK